MLKVNTHDLAIKGLKRASGRTCNERPYSDWHYTVLYNQTTGEVWTEEVYGRNTWVVHHDPDIIRIVDVQRHMTMQEIADEIERVLSLREENRA